MSMSKTKAKPPPRPKTLPNLNRKDEKGDITKNVEPKVLSPKSSINTASRVSLVRG